MDNMDTSVQSYMDKIWLLLKSIIIIIIVSNSSALVKSSSETQIFSYNSNIYANSLKTKSL